MYASIKLVIEHGGNGPMGGISETLHYSVAVMLVLSLSRLWRNCYAHLGEHAGDRIVRTRYLCTLTDVVAAEVSMYIS